MLYFILKNKLNILTPSKVEPFSDNFDIACHVSSFEFSKNDEKVEQSGICGTNPQLNCV